MRIAQSCKSNCTKLQIKTRSAFRSPGRGSPGGSRAEPLRGLGQRPIRREATTPALHKKRVGKQSSFLALFYVDKPIAAPEKCSPALAGNSEDAKRTSVFPSVGPLGGADLFSMNSLCSKPLFSASSPEGGNPKTGKAPPNYVKGVPTFPLLRFSPLGLPLFLIFPFVAPLLKERAPRDVHSDAQPCAGGGVLRPE